MFPSRRITIGGDVFRDEYSLTFDGTDDSADCGQGIDLGTDDFTIMGWVKCDLDYASTYIISQHVNTENYWYIRWNGSEPPRLQMYAKIGDAALNTYYGTQTINGRTMDDRIGEWVHFAISSDRDGNNVGYVNGHYDDADAADADDISHDASIRIGSSSTTYSDESISEIAIYNKALSSSEVKTIYNGREPYNHKEGIAISNLKAWWRMGDGTFDDVIIGADAGKSYGLVTDMVTPTLGSDLITDGNFPNGDNWTENDWTISGNKASLDGSQGGVVNLIQSGLSTIEGKTVKAVLEITDYTAGYVTFNLGGNPYVTSGSITALGVHTFYGHVTGDAGLLLIQADANFNGSISNVTMQIVGGNAGQLVNGVTLEGDTP